MIATRIRPLGTLFAEVQLALGCCLVALVPGSIDAEEYALLVAVDHCPNFSNRALAGPSADAEELQGILTGRFSFAADNVNLLINEEATQATVLAAMASLAQALQPDDVLLFYFAGHGTQLRDQAPLDETGDRLDEAFCLFDATPQGTGMIRDDTIAAWLHAELEANRVTVALDCCHSGTGVKASDTELFSRHLTVDKSSHEKDGWCELTLPTKSIERQLTAFYACQPGEEAYEKRFPRIRRRAGIFSQHWFAGLRTLKDVTNRQLFDFTHQGVRKSLGGSAPLQTPMFRTNQPSRRVFFY